jgi:hypothetical protein
VAVADAYADRREAVARRINGKAYADFREEIMGDAEASQLLSRPLRAPWTL